MTEARYTGRLEGGMRLRSLTPPARAPKISVITAVLNGARTLDRTIRSVATQVGIAIEHIVVDGGSTDGTLDVIRRHESALAYWVSEPDSGIADAMNKGVKLARADWLLFLHADDRLAESSSLATANPSLHDPLEVVAFPVDFETSGGSRRRIEPRRFAPWLNLKTCFPHQGTFIHRRLFERTGAYDDRYTIAMDYEFFLRAYRRKAKIAVHRTPCVSVMGGAGISSQRDPGTLARRFGEERRIHLQHARGSCDRLLYAIYWPLYLAYRRRLHARDL